MTASLGERARRRLLQDVSKDTGDGVPDRGLVDTIKEIEHRDAQDESRGVAPLKQADDAIVFDNSTNDREASIQKFIQLLRAKGLPTA